MFLRYESPVVGWAQLDRASLMRAATLPYDPHEQQQQMGMPHHEMKDISLRAI